MKYWLFALLAMTLLTRAAFAAPTESPMTLKASGGTLSGTFMVPDGRGPFPVALIIAGSGAVDRDGNEGAALQTNMYKVLAQSLAAAGIATLRYDKRGVGQSVFPGLKQSAVRFEDFVGDADLLARRLDTDPRFSRVSIIGHSEGSLIGMLVAQKVAGLTSYVSLEGAGAPAGEVILSQIRPNIQGTPYLDEATAVTHALEAGKTIENVSPALAALYKPSIQPYLISWFKYNPAVEIAKIKLPVLIVQGTHDIQVGVSDANSLSAALPAAKLLLIDGMNHILRDAPSDKSANIATYNQPSLPLNAKIVPAIVAFLLSPK